MTKRIAGTLLPVIILFLLSPVFTSDSFGQVAMPRIKFRERTLTNGLRVLSAVDNSSPTVAIQVWYHVGSKTIPMGAAVSHTCSSTSCLRPPGT